MKPEGKNRNTPTLLLIHQNVKLYLLSLIYIYVTVNMCNQGIRVFPEIFSEYAYSPKWSGNTCIP